MANYLDHLALPVMPPLEGNQYANLIEELALWSNVEFTLDTPKQTMPTAATNATVTSSPSSSSLSSSPALSLKQESYPATLQSIAPALLFPTQSDLVKETAPRRLLPKATDDPIVNITDLIKPDAGPTTPTNRKRAHSKDGDDISAEEEKRRRNTAASARFRAKKKMRERALEQTVRDMTTKSETLEERMESLEREIKWLRGLLIEKHQLENEPPSSMYKSAIVFGREYAYATSLSFQSKGENRLNIPVGSQLGKACVLNFDPFVE